MSQMELRLIEDFYDRNAEKYSNMEYNGDFFFQESIHIPAIRRIVETLSFNDVLDIGCGTGLFSRFFANMNKNVYAIDMSNNMLNFARKTSRESKITFFKGNILNYDFKGQKFDLLFASFVVNYFDNLDSFWLKLKLLLNNKGSIIVTMLHPLRTSSERINYDYYKNMNYLEKGQYESDFLGEKILLHKFTISEILNSLSNGGLKVVGSYEPKPNVEHSNVGMVAFYTSNPSIWILHINKK